MDNKDVLFSSPTKRRVSVASFSEVRNAQTPAEAALELLDKKKKKQIPKTVHHKSIYVSCRTSRSQVRKAEAALEEGRPVGRNGRPPVFFELEEIEIFNRLEDKYKNRIGVTRRDFEDIAYQVTVDLEKVTNRKIILRLTKSVALRFLHKYNSTAYNANDVIEESKLPGEATYDEMFRMGKEIRDKKTYKLHHIYNMDESQVAITSMAAAEFVWCKNGVKPIIRGVQPSSHLTLIGCVSAVDRSVPAAFVSRRDELNEELFAAEGRIPPPDYCTPSGYMTQEKMLEWFEEVFVVSSSIYRYGQPILLFMDAHISRYSTALQVLLVKYDIDVVILPGGYTQFFQPLDMGIFRAFKHALFRQKKNTSIEKCMMAAEDAWAEAVTPVKVREAWRSSRLLLNNLEDFKRGREFGDQKVRARATLNTGTQYLNEVEIPEPKPKSTRKQTKVSGKGKK